MAERRHASLRWRAGTMQETRDLLVPFYLAQVKTKVDELNLHERKSDVELKSVSVREQIANEILE